MVAVNSLDGIKYGFRLLGYLVVVGIIGGGILGLGFLLLADDSLVLGSILLLVGYLTFFAGQFGIIYKIIADGVSAGVTDAGVSMGGAQQQPPQAQQQPQQQQYQGGRR